MFNEANSVEDFIRDLLASGQAGKGVREGSPQGFYGRDSVGLAATGLGWNYIPGPQLPRQQTDVLLDAHLRAALIRLNPEIAAQPDRADEVFYKLRAILLAVRGDGLVRANEEFAAWLLGERSMPFGPNNQHSTVRLIDFANPANNQYVVSTQVTFRSPEKRFDLVLYVNGIPLVLGEAKSPVRPAVSWFDGAYQVREDYEVSVQSFFVPNVFSFATEGKEFRFGAIRMPLELWAPWREAEDNAEAGGLREVETAVKSLLQPAVVLDILKNFTIFATDKKHRKIKIICRFQQYYGANKIVARVLAGRLKKGLIWHFQGSGKSLLMVFAAQKLRLEAALQSPTVLIVVDRIDLDTQITATFNAADVPNTVATDSREELERLLAQDARKVIITTIHKFAEMKPDTNKRSNIIVMVDEAHRTQEGDLGRKMRAALPNAFFFGLTGTPINRRDRNTFWAFGAEEDEHGYMSRYSFAESIRDEATLPLHFEARLVELHVDRAAIDDAFAAITGDLSDEDQANLSRRVGKLSVLLKAPERIRAICADIVRHFRATVEPNGFKAMIVTFDRESCVLFKQELDRLMPPLASDVIMTVDGREHEWKQYDRRRDEEERILDRFRDPSDPLQILIVTARLLTGFDAPILQAMYLDKPIKEHNLVQAICRANRPYPSKTHALIVDYIGVFDDVARALDFDEQSMQKVISNIDELKAQLSPAMAKCLDWFPGVDRSQTGYEGLIAAQECLPHNDSRDEFAQDYSLLAALWEALSPDPALLPYETDYRWLTQVYDSLRPASGQGKLLWHVLGAKTVELIHENVHVVTVRDDLETLIMDPVVLSSILTTPDPTTAKEIEIKIAVRLRRHRDNPRFIELGQRLEDVRERHERGLMTSLAFLKHLLEIARAVLEAEKQVDPVTEQHKGLAALTELFNEVRGSSTPIMVERIVGEIDEIVRVVRFDGWQQTVAGERDVRQALRKVLLKYQLHRDQDLFDRAYRYIEQYY